MKFPTVVVDDFFADPQKIIEWANTLEYDLISPNYPGARTQCLSTINEKVFEQILVKILSILNIKNFECDAHIHFQKVPSDFSKGIIHRDATLTSIVFLNENTEEFNSGTSTYKPKNEFPNIEGELMKEIIGSKDYGKYEEVTDKVNSQFTNSININGEYNRMVLFDGMENYHAANEFGHEERLTLICFIDKLGSAEDPRLISNIPLRF
jgi:hypothetical protein